jgi:tripartite-type tricarboxylate transporter receptor subunit TctC
MISRRNFTRTAVALAAVAGLGLGVAQAQTVEEFYKGKTVTLIVSAAPGGGADLFARSFIKVLPKYIPGNPNVVITNLPGAGGLTAAAQLQANEVRDGTVFAMLQRNNLYLPLVSAEPVPFDPQAVNWLGSLNKEFYALVAWENAEVKNIDDLLSKPLKVGATGFNNENRTYPAIINQFMGGQIEIVAGYAGNDEIALAMERGEVQGRALTVTSLLAGNDAEWLKDGKINVIAQMSMTPHPSIPDVPMILDYAKDDTTKALLAFMFAPLEAGRPFAAPPEVPADRLEALRSAFIQAAADPDFIAELAAQNTTVDAIDGAAVEAIVDTVYGTPPEVLAEVKKLLTPQ